MYAARCGVRALCGARQEAVDRFADELVAPVLEQLLDHRVDEHDRARFVDDEDAVGSGVDGAAQRRVGHRRHRRSEVRLVGHA